MKKIILLITLAFIFTQTACSDGYYPPPAPPPIRETTIITNQDCDSFCREVIRAERARAKRDVYAPIIVEQQYYSGYYPYPTYAYPAYPYPSYPPQSTFNIDLGFLFSDGGHHGGGHHNSGGWNGHGYGHGGGNHSGGGHRGR